MSVDVVLRDAIHAAVREVLPEVVRTEVVPALAELREALAPAATASPGEYVSTRQAAAIASVQPATIRRWMAEGKLRECRAGRHIRVRVDDLRACMEAAAETPKIDLEERALELIRGGRKAAG